MLTMARLVRRFVIRHWKMILALTAPFALSPIFIVHDSKESRCAYGILIMALYWMFELLHLSVTSLLPVFMFPMLGILTTAESTAPYMKDAIMMYLAGMIIASAVEHCNLHYRMALRILLLIGTSTIWVMLGFMFTAMFLSMWLNNMATTLMVLPIVDSVVSEIRNHAEANDAAARPTSMAIGIQLEDTSSWKTDEDKTQHANVEAAVEESVPAETAVRAEEHRQFHNAMLLAIAYAANIGGTGSVLGTAPNLVLMGLVEDQYPAATELTFATWMFYNVPPMLLCVTFAWLYLYYMCIPREYRKSKAEQAGIRDAIESRYRSLGPMSFHEAAVLAIFVLTVLTWFFRDPYVVTGWSSFFALQKKIHDATPAIFAVVLLFLVPANPLKNFSGPRLLSWKIVQKKIPWGVLLLMGGSFSMAEASTRSGLANKVGSFLTRLDFMPQAALLIVICIFTTMITEVTSNTATASVLLPITSYLAQALEIHPLYLMIPVTISASFAFMLPVATPPNAMVYEHGGMSMSYMARAGLIMNIGCVIIELIAINTIGVWIFNLNSFPSWARAPNVTRTALRPGL